MITEPGSLYLQCGPAGGDPGELTVHMKPKGSLLENSFICGRGSVFLLYSSLQLIGWGPPILRSSICFLIKILISPKKHSHRNSQSNIWPNIWSSCAPVRLTCVLPPFGARQVHGIHADGKIFMEPLGCLACLYSRAGEPRTLQAVCLSACFMSWPLLPSVAPIMAPVPLSVSHHHHPQQGVPTCFKYQRGTKPENCQNIT